MKLSNLEQLQIELAECKEKINKIYKLGGDPRKDLLDKRDILEEKVRKLQDPSKFELEKQFEREYNEFIKLKDTKLNEINKLIDELIQLSKDKGFPFDIFLCKRNNTYVPASLKEKWKDIDESILDKYDILFDQWYGWQRSDC